MTGYEQRTGSSGPARYRGGPRLVGPQMDRRRDRHSSVRQPVAATPAATTPSEKGGAPTEYGARHRIVAVDNLKAVLVGWGIASHALLGYLAIGGWPYDEVQGVTLPPRLESVMSVLLGPTAFVVVGAFFFIAGLFAPLAMAHEGPSLFARNRLLRLGAPAVVVMAGVRDFNRDGAALPRGLELAISRSGGGRGISWWSPGPSGCSGRCSGC